MNRPPPLSVLETPLQRVGILGGTFNPVHNGHLAIACQAQHQCNLDWVLWMPAGDPPHKPLAKGASTEDRLEMVKLAISSCPRFVCSDIEICRNGPSFAVETLNILHRAYPQTHWFWIIGADAARDLPSWYRIHDLVHLCDWIVLSRPGATSAETELQRLRGILAIRGIPLDSTEADISSTQVRESVRSGRGLNSLVPAAVESYIRTHNLYADSTALR